MGIEQKKRNETIQQAARRIALEMDRVAAQGKPVHPNQLSYFAMKLRREVHGA